MKERPILFSSEMVRAILAGKKTQTRRIIKESFNGCLTNGGPHPCPNDPVLIIPDQEVEFNGETIKIDFPEVRAIFHCSTLDSEAKCRYGKVGDLLWVRETWCRSLDTQGEFYYKATEPQVESGEDDGSPWKPSIHMPKAAARIWLEVEEIKVETLQDISEEDAIAEGIGAGFQLNAGWPDYTRIKNGVCELTQDDPRMSYASLWDSINGEGAWKINPWVWVVKYKVLSTTGRPS